MANHASHAALPYPIKGARFTIAVPFLDADGDPTDPTTPDTSVSEDGADFVAAAEEVSTIGGTADGVGYITLTGAETDCSMLAVQCEVASGPKATIATLYPRVLAVVVSGTTLDAGSASGGTIASGDRPAYDVTGCYFKTTGGTGGGGANNQVRKIVTYTPSTGVFTVSPNFETAISTDTDWDILLPEGVTLGMLRTLNPTTPGRTLSVGTDNTAQADVAKWLAVAPLALASQRVQVDVVAVGANTTVVTNLIEVFATGFATAWNTTNNLWNADVRRMVGTDLSGSGQVGANFNQIFSNDGSPTTLHLDLLNPGTAIVNYGLDHLVFAAVAGADVADNSIIAKMVSKNATADWDSFVNTSDSLEALRDNYGVAQTGDSFTRIGVGGSGLNAIPWNVAWDAEVESEAVDALEARGVTTTVTGRIDAAISSRAATGAEMALVSNAITTAKIQDGAITSAKFTVAAISGVATGILEKLDQLWRRFFKKHVHDKVAKTIKTYGDNGSTVLTTQTYTSDANTDDVGAAT